MQQKTLLELEQSSDLKGVLQLGKTGFANWRIRDSWKREKPEEIVAKLRQMGVLQGQETTDSEAGRQGGVAQAFYICRRLIENLFGNLKDNRCIATCCCQ